MADIKSELPIRSQLPGQVNFDDVIIKMADGTTSTQLASVDTHGSQQSTIADSGGNIVTSQANGAQRALDVGIDVAGVQIDPRQIRALTSADVVTVDQGTSPWVTKDLADGSVSGGTAGTFSLLGGLVYNSTPLTLTNGQQASLQGDVSGYLKVDLATSLPAGSNNIGQVGVTNFPTTVDTNFGTVGASTIRVAAEPGNATGIADFNNGATGVQTLRVAANLAVAGANVSATNPVPVQFSSAPLGTAVNNYNTAAAVAANATSNHIYTITAAKTFQGKKIWASASGLMKIEVRVSPDGSTYSSLWVGFNSAANPNITIDMDEMVFLESGTGATIEVIRTNLDHTAQDVYSTISGTEV
jgi:hypothetical protein